MRVYVVESHSSFHDRGKRVCDLHETVFHGIGYYPTLEAWVPRGGVNEKGEGVVITRPLDWRWPGVTNQNRELLHITRSGRFVPPVFSFLFTEFVVSPEVRKALSSLPNVGFNQVVFEQLVYMPMPKLVALSWYEGGDSDEYDARAEQPRRALPQLHAL